MGWACAPRVSQGQSHTPTHMERDTRAAPRSLAKLGKQECSKLFKDMEMAHWPLSNKLATQWLGLEGRRWGQRHQEPWRKSRVARSGRRKGGLLPESRVLGTNRGQRMGGEMGWAGPELAHLLIKLSLQTGLTTEGISVT